MSPERMTPVHGTPEPDDGTDGQALSVLRGIWTAQRQSAADIAPSTAKVCKNMKNIGFGGFGAPDGPGSGVEGESTAGPVDEDQRVAWRERLAREGKLVRGSTTVRDLVLGPETVGPETVGPETESSEN